MLPDGADSMVMVEYSEAFGPEETAIYKAVSHLENLVEAGDDVKTGAVVLKKGTRIGAKEIAVLAAMGVVEVPVYTAPKMTIISTGDELMPAETEQVPTGKIRDISSHSLKALAAAAGFEVTGTVLLADEAALLEAALIDKMKSSDLVVVSGGSSYGKHDITAQVIDKVAAPGVFTHGLAVKPGKPTILAADEGTQTLVIGLPGHPMSAMVVFELLMGELMRSLTAAMPKPPIPARLTVNVQGAGGKTTFYPCCLLWDGSAYLAEPVFGKSALITSLTKADGYFLIDAHTEGLHQDAQVFVHLF
jgi:molybdopterin molybdotransferase